MNVEGSSPLTRGKLLCLRCTRREPRLIPAHAGKTWLRGTLLVRARAHPRSRGENGFFAFVGAWRVGSSPLTRGKLASPSFQATLIGLIPAHAGKTSIRWSVRPPVRAHPRSRGENSRPRSAASSRMGSSPLTRGKRSPPRTERVGGRLIPAHAGKTHIA